MTRNQFLGTMAAGVLATGAAEGFKSDRVDIEWAGDLSAPPEKVFPLLCPVREYEWIADWKCDLIYTKSGVAEDLCNFVTHYDGDEMTWTATRYEPPLRIEYVGTVARRYVMCLRITLERTGKGTKIRWHRIFTGLSPEGNKAIAGKNDGLEKVLCAKLEHFLTTGKML